MTWNSNPSVWIEKTYREGREYKQSGEYALGKAIYSPSRNKAGADEYKTMREAEVGDVVLHLLQEVGEIVGVSIIDTELDTDFDGLPEFEWTEEQYEQGGYLRWLTDYEELDDPVDFYEEVLEKDAHEEQLLVLREEHKHLPYTRGLSLTEGDYLARCPDSLARIIANQSSQIEEYLSDAGLALNEQIKPGEGDSGGEKEPFNSITSATDTILERLTESEYGNILEEEVSAARVEQWSRALNGFNPGTYVPPEEEEILHDIEHVLNDLRPRLETIATDLNVGQLDHVDPPEVVFLAFLRSLQQQYDIGIEPNSSQTKLNVLQQRAYEAFDNPNEPIVEHLRNTGAMVYKVTAPPDFWLTTLRHRVYGFENDEEGIWEDLTRGDILVLHAAGPPMHDELETRNGFVFGAGVVGQTRTAKESEQWWYDAIKGRRRYPYLATFDRLFLAPGASRLGDAPPPTSDVQSLGKAIDTLAREAVPITELNDRCNEVCDESFPSRHTALRIEADSGFGIRETVLDLLAEQVSEVAPIAVYPGFDGTVPPKVFNDLHFPDDEGVLSSRELAQQITAALRSGKHIIFTGPPGTGKTEVARSVAEFLEKEYSYLYSGSRMTTATADWSTFDTVGGYMPNPDSDGDQLDFKPGIVLNRFQESDREIQANELTIVDEINRANIDEAFGQLFTTLSGQAVTLPYRFEAAPEEEIQIVTADATNPPFEKSTFVVPTSWRILATMNTFDKTSLYELSYAFMRRFSFIRLGVPDLSDAEYIQEELLLAYTSDWDIDVDDEVLRSVATIWKATNEAVPERSIGPAIVQDILSYVASHEEPEAHSDRLTEAVISYVFPQLEGVPERDDIVREIVKLDVISPESIKQAARDMLSVTSLEDDNE